MLRLKKTQTTFVPKTNIQLILKSTINDASQLGASDNVKDFSVLLLSNPADGQDVFCLGLYD